MRPWLTLSATILATPALADMPVVVTDIPVVHSLVSQVMGDLGQPVVLLEPGADPHSFQLRPSQARALGNAALVFWVGEELTPWVARAIASMATEATSVPLLHVDGVRRQGFGHENHEDDHGHDDQGHDHAHEDSNDHGDDHGHDDAHDHDHEGADPHAWLDPDNAQVWLGTIAAHLAEADPENAAAYAENAAAASAGIDALAGQVVELLAPVKDAPIVTFHDAYGYFEHAFGVNIAGSIALGDATAPGAQRLRALQTQIGEDSIACIFREPQHDASIAEAVAADAGIGLGTLDPSGSSLPYGPELYGSLLTGLAQSIADCVSGRA